MGQRHQIFLNVVNPKNKFKDELTKTQKQGLGLKKTAILPFHNQWLYGRTALVSAANVLIHSAQFTKTQKTNDSWDGEFGTPFCFKGIGFDKCSRNFEKYINSIEFIMNFCQKETVSRNAGFLGSWYLGNEDNEYAKRFDIGDNNDGITIIDTVNNKYCFMNIYHQDEKSSEHHDVGILPQFKPCSAREYVEAYYGTTLKTLNPYYLSDLPEGKTKKDVLKEHKEANEEAIALLEGFEVMTVAEVIKLFPAMKDEMLRLNGKKVAVK